MGLEEPGFWYTGMILSVLPAIDRGVLLDPGETRRHLVDGDLFDWLEQQLEDWRDPTAHDDTARLAVLREIQGLVDGDSLELAPYRDGLCLLVACCTARLQQML